jgi:ATP-citrate lyase beta-subunit
VANFTDIAKTFAGVIKAIDEVKDELKVQNVKVFVRRGGPNQEIGLAKMEALLTRANLLGAVHDPATPLTVAVGEALQEIKSE